MEMELKIHSSHVRNTEYHTGAKTHIFPKYSHFSKNSQFQNHILHKIHTLHKISISQNLGDLWTKN